MVEWNEVGMWIVLGVAVMGVVVLAIALFLGIMALIYGIAGYILMLAWNLFMPLFGLMKLKWLEAVGLTVLLDYVPKLFRFTYIKKDG